MNLVTLAVGYLLLAVGKNKKRTACLVTLKLLKWLFKPVLLSTAEALRASAIM
jgi:hypothetical protein